MTMKSSSEKKAKKVKKEKTHTDDDAWLEEELKKHLEPKRSDKTKKEKKSKTAKEHKEPKDDKRRDEEKKKKKDKKERKDSEVVKDVKEKKKKKHADKSNEEGSRFTSDKEKKLKKGKSSKKIRVDSDEDSVDGSPAMRKRQGEVSTHFEAQPRQVQVLQSSPQRDSTPTIDVDYNDYNNSNPQNGEMDYDDDFEDYSDDFDDADEEEFPASEQQGVVPFKGMDRSDSNLSSSSGEDTPIKSQTASASKPKNHLLADIVNAVKEENAVVEATVSEGTIGGGGMYLDDDKTTTYDDGPLPERKIIDFATEAKRKRPKTKLSKKQVIHQKQRGEYLMHMLEGSLEEVQIDILDIAPMTEYELYMQQFGRLGTDQRSTQTQEDAIEFATQTEIFNMENVWTQYPPEDLNGWGREEDSTDVLENGKSSLFLNLNSVRLSKFVQSVGPVFCALLQENFLTSRKSKGSDFGVSKTFKSSIALSSSYMQIPSTLSFLAGRPIKHVNFSNPLNESSVETVLLVTTYGKYSNSSRKGSVSGTGNAKGWSEEEFKEDFLSDKWDYENPSFLRNENFICIWDYLFDPHRPKHILITECTPTYSCFSAHNQNSLLFAGTEEGIIQVWDLREPEFFHRRCTIGGVEYLIRKCSFSTDSMGGSKLLENKGLTPHQSRVEKIFPVITRNDAEEVEKSTLRDDEDHSSQMSRKSRKGFCSFQVCSLSDDGLLNVWVAIELSTLNEQILDSEFGLNPGSKVKLVLSSSVFVDRRQQGQKKKLTSIADTDVTIRAFDICLSPEDVNQYFVTTDVGSILHGLKFGATCSPKEYFLTEDFKQWSCQIISVDVNTIDFSPFFSDFFIVGLSNGKAVLYKTTNPDPVCSFDNAITDSDGNKTSKMAGIVRVFWSATRPAVFFAVDTNGLLYAWDLLASTHSPACVSDLSQAKRGDDKEKKSSRRTAKVLTLMQSPPREEEEDRSLKSHLCLGFDNGAVEIHLLSDNLSIPIPKELEKVNLLLQSIR
eukprot:Nk52_evm5s223 gene=Nk52_evmTU5s223